MNDKLFNNHGFVTLIAVMVISAVGLSIALSLLLLGLGADRSSLVLSYAKEAESLAISCAEESLESIRKNISYTGTVNLTVGNGTCSSTVINTGGEGREIQATGIVDTTYARTRILINVVSNNINITTWERVATFN